MSDVIGAVQAATIEGSVAARATIQGTVGASATLGGVEVGGIIVSEISLPPYDGAYAITPSDEAQTLATADKRMAEDLVIGPIPSNYGRITWDGHSIRVS